MGTELPSVHTQVAVQDVVRALTAAWENRFGGPVNLEPIILLAAQSALETGRWKSAICWNLAGIKAPVTTATYAYTYTETWEALPHDLAHHLLEKSTPAEPCAYVETLRDGRLKMRFMPRHSYCRFRAYTTLADACADYLAFLHDNPRYRPAWDALESADPAAFVRQLASHGYFTGNIADYVAGVTSLYAEFLRDSKNLTWNA